MVRERWVPAAHRGPPGAIDDVRSPSSSTASSWQCMLRRPWPWICCRTSVCSPSPADPSGRLGSASAREFPGLVLFPEPQTALEVAEALIHEGAHQKFFDLRDDPGDLRSAVGQRPALLPVMGTDRCAGVAARAVVRRVARVLLPRGVRRLPGRLPEDVRCPRRFAPAESGRPCGRARRLALAAGCVPRWGRPCADRRGGRRRPPSDRPRIRDLDATGGGAATDGAGALVRPGGQPGRSSRRAVRQPDLYWVGVRRRVDSPRTGRTSRTCG